MSVKVGRTSFGDLAVVGRITLNPDLWKIVLVHLIGFE
jgi:hypothetical protein